MRTLALSAALMLGIAAMSVRAAELRATTPCGLK